MDGTQQRKRPRNRQAATLIRRTRVDQGLTPEALATKITADGAGTVSGRTIRRIEDEGVIPVVRIQFALARWLQLNVSQVWGVPKARSTSKLSDRKAVAA